MISEEIEFNVTWGKIGKGLIPSLLYQIYLMENYYLKPRKLNSLSPDDNDDSSDSENKKERTITDVAYRVGEYGIYEEFRLVGDNLSTGHRCNTEISYIWNFIGDNKVLITLTTLGPIIRTEKLKSYNNLSVSISIIDENGVNYESEEFILR